MPDYDDQKNMQEGSYDTFKQGFPSPFGGFSLNPLAFPTLPKKASPTDLAEYINKSVEQIGASISVMETNGNIPYTTNAFYLTSMGLSMRERVQLLETMDSAHLSFFDESVRVYSFGGTALDYTTSDMENPEKYFHQSSLIDMYNDVLRGSKLIESNRIGVIKVYNHLIYGYPLNLNINYSAAADRLAQFSMQWAVVKHNLGYLVANVTEDSLKNNYIANYKKQSSEYNQVVTQLLKVVDGLIEIKNWEESDAKALTQAVFSNGKVIGHTSNFWYNLSKDVKSYAKSQLKSRITALKEQLAEVEGGALLSGLITELFPPQPNDAYWDEVLICASSVCSISETVPDYTKFSTLDTFFQTILQLRWKLINYKTQIVQ